MATEPTPTLNPCDSGGRRSCPRPSISQRWLNWCSAPEAGREEAWACMASPDMKGLDEAPERPPVARGQLGGPPDRLRQRALHQLPDRRVDRLDAEGVGDQPVGA